MYGRLNASELRRCLLPLSGGQGVAGSNPAGPTGQRVVGATQRLSSLVARTWHWVLHGGGRGPISHMDWSKFDGDGPPSAATLAAESTASQPPLHPAVSWDELNRARFICGLCTSQPEAELPLRFHPWDAAPAPAASAEGSVTITTREIRDA